MAKAKKAKHAKHRLSWNWPAFLLGPLWYAWHSMWGQAALMFVVLVFSGFVLVFPLAIYCALRFDEDHQDFVKKSKVKGQKAKLKGKS